MNQSTQDAKRPSASTHPYAHRSHGPSAQPGAMTAVMRALVPSTGPKLLRVGLVQAGQVLEDRLIKDRGSVTVGSSEAATFVVPRSGELVKLFERKSSAYVLHVQKGMTGRVSFETGIVDLATLREPRLALTDDARGKVTFGDATFLFQLVPPPMPATRPQLPLAIKGGLGSSVDWGLTIIAAFSFLVHFGVVGAMYSDWMDPIVDTQASANGVVDMVKHLPALDPETPPPAATEPSPSASAPPDHPSVASAPVRHVDHASAAPKPMTPNDVAALSQAAQAIGISALVALGSTESAVARALNTTDIPPVDLGKSAASSAGVEQASGSGIHFGSGAVVVRPGDTQAGLSALALHHAETGKSGRETEKAGPTVGVVNVSPLPPTSTGEDIGATRVVAGLRAGFRSCYNQGLGTNPEMSGKVMLIAKVGPNGEVASTSSSDNAGLSPSVVQCLLTKLGTAQFDAGHSATTVKIPAGFVPAAK